MGLEALLSRLENRLHETPETPCNLGRVSAYPALSLVRTLETPATPQIDNSGSDAEILDRHPTAIVAEPEPAWASCSTCAHETGRGGCGEPVAAGLSSLEGVIRYHPTGGEGCSAWVGTLISEMEFFNA